MECLVSTERSKPKAVSKLRAGAPIANIVTSDSVHARAEAVASNATVTHMAATNLVANKTHYQSRQAKFSISSLLRGTCSVFVNLGIDPDLDTISSIVSGAFGSAEDRLIEQILNSFIANGKADGTITDAMTDAEIIRLFLLFLDSSGFISNVASAKETIKGSSKFRDLDAVTTISGLDDPVTVQTPRVFPFFSASDDAGTSYGGALLRDNNGKIDAKAQGGVISVASRVRAKSNFKNTYVDKIGGHVEKFNKLLNFSATQKFYPVRDINTTKNGVAFVDKTLAATGLYQSVDEGLFTGHYTKPFGTSSRISDDFGSFIQPSSVFSKGNFNYECELTPPHIKPVENFLFIRAAAPMSVLESDIPPQYRIHNIKWTDPDGNIISAYKDINVRGDSKFSREDENYNFATYVTEAVVDNAKRYNWDTYEKLPSFTGVNGYKLNMDFEVTCFHRPFSPEFNKGYEDGCSLDFVITDDNDYVALDGSPLSTKTQGFDFTPNNSIRISNIEIAASGSKAPLAEHFMPLYSLPPTETLRTTRKIYPTEILLQDYNTRIHPEVQTLWRSSPDRGVYSFNNTANDKAGMKKALRDFQSVRYIELISTSPIADSGKLKIKFEHEPPVSVKQPTNGEWGIGAKNPNSRLNTAKLEIVPGPDEFFEVDTIELHITARKAVGSRDYALDVVGFTDDGLLNVSSAVDGFLQNKDAGIGTIPTATGFNQSNYLTSSAETVSSREGYFSQNIIQNTGGDHYILTNTPMVTGTTLEDYVIPLQIYRKQDKFGFQQDYSGSNNFESLILDIYPLPTGAVIARADLQVTYKPSNAITMYTLGHGPQEVTRRAASLQLEPMKSNDGRLNAIWTEKPLSLIEDIPHAFTTPQTLKTNYARRWRGVDGRIKAGPFQADQFDFAFDNPELTYPFTKGHYKFNDVDGNTIYSDQNPEISYTGTYNAALADNIISNIGMRFQTNKIFGTQDRDYRTIDWTTVGHELSGKIMDAFDKAVRVDQSSKNINYGDINTDNGFSVLARFSPDVNVSGADYNLFNSGVLVSKWDAGKDLEFTLGYKDGKITGHARDNAGNVVTVQDPLTYTNYSFPLATVLTYNDQGSNKLRLYTDNEIASGNFNSLRASSAPFVMHTGDSNLVVGHSSGSGVGMSAFVTEFGIAESNDSGTLIVPASPNIARQESNIDRFFDSFRSKFWNVGETYEDERFKLWDFLNERASKWHIGSFKFCEFGAAFDTMSNRIGEDYILHEHKATGDSYGTMCDVPLPNNVLASGLSYHTQIENDFLRMHLGDVNNKFIAADPRLVKTFPRSYDPATESIAVDTIIEQDGVGDILWPDGNVGPKLIVSLYTKRKETDLFDSTNWGLINRDFHYIAPDDCWRKRTSRFTVQSVRDESEPWASFNRSQLVKETNHHHYSNNINEMFVQYDLAYPSGNFESRIRMHSAEVRLENALHLKDVLYVDDFILYTSGEPVVNEEMNLYCQEPIYSSGTDMNIFASGGLMPVTSGRMNLISSGVGLISNEQNPLSLYLDGPVGFASSKYDVNSSGMSLHTIGIPDFFSSAGGGNFGSIGSEYIDNTASNVMFGAVGDRGRSETIFALYTENDQLFNGPHSLAQQPLFVRGVDSDGNEHNDASNSFNIFTHGSSNYYYRNEQNDTGAKRLNVPFTLFVHTEAIDQTSSGVMSLHTVDGVDPNILTATGSMPLHTINVNPINDGQNYLSSFQWNGNNAGTSIQVVDNEKLSLDANDEIRGVVTMCYANCDNNGNCIEQELYTHNTLWVKTECLPGGVIRPINVYNNDNTIGYNTIETGYSNNYYGARKFTGLIPAAPYNITITAKTGTSGILEVPREITEIEYGTNDQVDYSGVKLVAEDGSRNLFDQFAYSVDIAGDLMAVGVPGIDLEDNGVAIPEAGSVFVYRRNPAPSGYDWSGQDHKSSWLFEAQLSMPSGYRLDRHEKTKVNIFQAGVNVGQGDKTYWFNGQKGRELGRSVAVSSYNGKDVIVAGGPGSKWLREFTTLDPDPVRVVLFIFTDEFAPTVPWPRRWGPGITTIDWQELEPAISEKDTYYKYFCDPSVRFDVHIVICEGVLGQNQPASSDFSDDSAPVPTFIHKRQISRISGISTISERRAENAALNAQLQDIYHELFPLDSSIINNGLPPIVGFYVDDSLSYGPRALGSTSPDKIQGGALGAFQTWLSDYAYTNGLVDYAGDAARPYFTTKIANDEGWISQAKEIFAQVLDPDVIIANGSFKLFANNMGIFRQGLEEYNIPSPSGGAVYVFEKFDHGWDIIQEINSPSAGYDHVPDRYGHDVAISEQGNVLVVGSPFVEEAVQIFENNSSQESQFYNRFVTWLRSTNDTSYGEIYQAQQTFNNLPAATTNEIFKENAKNVFGNSLSPSGRYTFRLHDNRFSSKFSLRQTYSYGDAGVSHNWGWLANDHMPTSRIGYSVDVSDDGTTIVVGCPTDSLGARDEGVFWYKPGIGWRTSSTQWFSNVNAGAVRVLEGRKYYPHDTAMQYGIFGNLHRTLSNAEKDDPLFNHYSSCFRNYVESEFTDPEIPNNVGTLMIITPEIDSLSEEVIQNIKDWLALGDRHLVLVGDDPIYEKNEDGMPGAYNASNKIINRLLAKLDSRMRIHPARNRYESLIDQSTGLYKNIVPSFVPSKTTPSFLNPGKMRASGVADIRLHDTSVNDRYSCDPGKREYGILAGLDLLPQIEEEGYPALHSKCNPPIVHEGDLRAWYYDQCAKTTPKGIVYVNYQHNIAWNYQTHQLMDWDCDQEDRYPAPKATYEPTPVLAAAESLTKESIREEVPERIIEKIVVVGKEFVPNPDFKRFPTRVKPQPRDSFYWTASSGNYTDLNYNVFNTLESESKFLDVGDPILQENNKTAIAMAKSEILGSERPRIENITEDFVTGARESYGSSEVHLLSMVQTEGLDILNLGDDSNGIFYMNLVDMSTANQIGGGSRIVQLGGFTGHDNFRSAYPVFAPRSGSALKEFFSNLGHSVVEGLDPIDMDMPGRNFDVAWIANPDGRPSDQELQSIKNWLNAKSGRKLIITFGDERQPVSQGPFGFPSVRDDEKLTERINNVDFLLKELNLTMQPHFLNDKSKYADLNDTTAGQASARLKGIFNLDFVYNSELRFGYRNQKSFIEENPAIRSRADFAIVAIQPNQATKTLSLPYPIQSTVYDSVGTTLIRSGTIKASFPVKEKTYYRVFFDEVSMFPSEKVPMSYTLTNCKAYHSFKPAPLTDAWQLEPSYSQVPLRERNAENPARFDVPARVSSNFSLEAGNRNLIPLQNNPAMRSITFLQDEIKWLERPKQRIFGDRSVTPLSFIISIPEGVSSIDLFINGDYKQEVPSENPLQLDTYRLAAFSGVEIEDPIREFGGGFFKDITETIEEIIPAIPASTTEYTVTREISTPSSKYCPNDACIEHFTSDAYPNGQDIADGPVTAAQEIYHQAPFIAGGARSRITVLTDASMIQGVNVQEEDSSRIIPDVMSLIRSFSPRSYGGDEVGNGFSYREITKIVSPEKNSPARLLAAEENEGFNNLFGRYPQTRKPANYFGNDEMDVRITKYQWIQPGDVLMNKGSDFIEKKVPPPIETDDEARIAAQNQQRNLFSGIMASYGCYSKFNVEIDGTIYYDTGMGQHPPKLMEVYGYDFLDFDHVSHLMSGYPGDLFGYNVKIDKGTIYVGSPFAAFSGEAITNWDQVKANTPNGTLYKTRTGYYGGAGVVYRFEKTMNGEGLLGAKIPWEAVGKIQPNSLSVGDTNGRRSDRFGSKIAIDSDFMAISAPDHSDDALIVRNSGEFIRKEFNDQFSIGKLETFDTGDASLSQEIRDSGVVLNNAGAVYTYERRITDWGTKKQDWEFIQKVIPQGYNGRLEDDGFGNNLAVTRNARSDGDYNLIIGAPQHRFGNSGEAPVVSSGGALYSYDAIMRRPKPSFAHPDTNIEGRIYGEIGDSLPDNEKYLLFDFKNGQETDKLLYQIGIVHADLNGEIFIEASGQDKNDRGYARHRPYINSVDGGYRHGVFAQNFVPFFIGGKPPSTSGNMSLVSPAPEQNVYNNMSMFNNGVLGVLQGDDYEMNLYGAGVIPSSISVPATNGGQGFNLYTICSGVVSSGVNLYTRGKFV